MTTVRSLDSAWLAAGLVLATATALRPTNLPVGPGEIFLGLWAFVTAMRVVRSGHIEVTPTARVLVLFWLASFGLLVAGWLVALYLGIWYQRGYHSALAYSFVAFVVAMFSLAPGFAERARATIPFIVLFSVVPLVGLLSYNLVSFGVVGPLDQSGGLLRFYGWSQNPNQIAILLAPIPFLAVEALRPLSTPRRRSLLACAVIAALVIGVATRSDALVFAWLAASGAILASLGWRRLTIHHRPTRGLVLAGVASVVFVLAAGAFVATEGSVSFVEKGLLNNNNEGHLDERVRLWRHGLEAMTRSPLVGLGPGAYSGIDGPLGGYEAHNNIIDWATNTGFLGGAMLVGIFAWVLWRAWTAQETWLFAAAVAALSVGMFHLSLRHPVFWFVLAAAAVLSPAVRVRVEEPSPAPQVVEVTADVWD